MIRTLALLTLIFAASSYIGVEKHAMLATYPFDSTAVNQNPALQTQNNQKNQVLQFTIGDMNFVVQPGLTAQKEVPSKVLRVPTVHGSGFVPTNSGLKPNQDYTFLKSSSEYTYTTRAVVGGGVIEKIMSAGAQVGDEGRMILYKSATLAQVEVGGWAERLIRPFIVNETDIANRDLDTNWPKSGTAPSINVAAKSIVDNGGDGYNHV
jgi:hypothetical protein